jgi:hypothetical protein
MTPRRVAALVVAAAVLPYVPSLDNYFVQDDFGVVSLLAGKPAGYFPRWFVSTWMDGIWGYTPDEIRPFPAVSYQIAALWGAASPLANHVINVAFHAVNAWLVLALAREAAGLALAPATIAALTFALLPMHTESVAWITGRVDSMPACFFLAAFLLFVRWRRDGRRRDYAGALALCGIALFSKQNAVVLGPALVAYDVVLRSAPVRLGWTWVRPYVPFALLTLGYLGLRYVLFGEVARESMLNARQFRIFTSDAALHLERLVFGEPGVAMDGVRLAAIVALVAAATATAAARSASTRPLLRVLLFFGPIWIALAMAPTLVAGYASPRHMYLAAAGWAVLVAAPCAVLWSRSSPLARGLALAASTALLAAYAYQLRAEVARWDVRADVAERIVRDLDGEASSAPPGTLVIAGAPRASFDFAVPYALRPPFTSQDVTARLRVVTHSSLHCCPAHLWEPHTRGLLRAWLDDPARPPVVVMHWDARTGARVRVDDVAQPFMRELPRLLLDARDVASLDTHILDIVAQLTGGFTAK